MEKEKPLVERLHDSYESRMNDLRNFVDTNSEELKSYGLCLDTVEAGTFGENQAYTRYQLSWGGPSEEFRIFEDGYIEFWFMDWGEGMCLEVKGRDRQIVKEIIDLIS